MAKRFMVMCGDDFVTFKKNGLIKCDDWEGTKFKSKEDAQAAIDAYSVLKQMRVVEILEEIRSRISFG